MTVEVATFISDLQSLNPSSTDPTAQGDDHICLIKRVLQSTFPNAIKAFYFPQALTNQTGTLAASVQNSVIFYDTSGGNLSVTLPSSPVAGWWVDAIKTSVDTNAVTISPSGGTISTQFGAVATVRVGVVMSAARFIWTGSSWVCHKTGPMIGSTVNFDGASVPAGYMVLDGSTFNGTTFAELAAALGTTTLRDKRGRVEAGIDTATSRLINVFSGSLGATGGLDNHTLTGAQIPSHTHGGSANATGTWTHSHTVLSTIANPAVGGSVVVGVQGGGTYLGVATSGTLGQNQLSTNSVDLNHGHSITSDGGWQAGAHGITALGNSWHPNVQPTIITQKLIRAC